MSAEIVTRTDNGKVSQTIRLGNKDFELERSRVPVGFLRLDPSNQRLSYLLRRAGGSATDEQLHKMLWDLDQVKDLYNSIYQNGGLIQDPIVRRDGTVVEGNCRTVSLRELHLKYPDDPRWQHAYVQLLPAEVTDEQLTMLLGELHIAGRIEWRAFEQAEYVWKMNKVYGKTYDFLSSHLRWSRSKLAQKIAAYEETRSYIEESGDPEGINRFSHFEEFMKKVELREKREEEPAFVRDFRRWVKEGKFPDAKDVRDLPTILENDKALEAFEEGGARAAKQVLHEKNPSLGSNLWATIDRAAVELLNMPLVEIEDLKKGQESKLAKLRLLQGALRTVAQHANLTLK
jgi:hypothetical protein